MTKHSPFRLSPAFVISCVALFVALAGSAVAAGLVAKNSVGSPQIRDASVRNADLHDGLIGASKISPDAVDGTKIAPRRGRRDEGSPPTRSTAPRSPRTR